MSTTIERNRQNKVYGKVPQVNAGFLTLQGWTYPWLICVHLVVKDEGVEEAGGGVNAVEHRYNESGLVHLEAAVECNNLADRGCSKQDQGDDRGRGSKLPMETDELGERELETRNKLTWLPGACPPMYADTSLTLRGAC